jgi:hypothetical protein
MLSDELVRGIPSQPRSKTQTAISL